MGQTLNLLRVRGDSRRKGTEAERLLGHVNARYCQFDFADTSDFRHLSEQTLRTICGFLEPADLCAVASASKLWNNLSQDQKLWQHHLLTVYPTAASKYSDNKQKGPESKTDDMQVHPKQVLICQWNEDITRAREEYLVEVKTWKTDKYDFCFNIFNGPCFLFIVMILVNMGLYVLMNTLKHNENFRLASFWPFLSAIGFVLLVIVSACLLYHAPSKMCCSPELTRQSYGCVSSAIDTIGVNNAPAQCSACLAVCLIAIYCVSFICKLSNVNIMESIFGVETTLFDLSYRTLMCYLYLAILLIMLTAFAGGEIPLVFVMLCALTPLLIFLYLMSYKLDLMSDVIARNDAGESKELNSYAVANTIRTEWVFLPLFIAEGLSLCFSCFLGGPLACYWLAIAIGPLVAFQILLSVYLDHGGVSAPHNSGFNYLTIFLPLFVWFGICCLASCAILLEEYDRGAPHLDPSVLLRSKPQFDDTLRQVQIRRHHN